ncbi:hypothetical protein BYT27DRAFT_7174014 [Phlegmacium glaucopus]|nr:hypothetical protein BYT27DRAFT_7174014 [Phlegmacium glaucopus]
MHLIWENLMKNLILLWTGEFKGLDEGHGEYVVANAIWEGVGAATHASGTTIPSAYGSRVPNIATDRSYVSAEMWSFWTLYLGPVLLRGRFQDVKYYHHFIQLIYLLTICLQFEISTTKIEEIDEGFVRWVQDYEDIYYQHNPDRLSTCPLTIHALLHIAGSIRTMGPVWCYWAFPMERYCGKLQPAIRSRRYPYQSMDRFLIEDAQLTQIKLLFDESEQLSLRLPHGSRISGQFSHPAYPTCVFLPPSRKGQPSNIVIGLLASAFLPQVTISQAKKIVRDAEIVDWGKVKHVDSEEGDTMYASALCTLLHDSREASFVRYEILVDKYAGKRHMKPEYIAKTSYGELEHIYSVKISDAAALGTLSLKQDVVVFATIRTCVLDPTPSDFGPLDIHLYSKMGSLDVVDITTIQCLVGRVRDRGNTWALIDRSGSLARAIYVDDEDV